MKRLENLDTSVLQKRIPWNGQKLKKTVTNENFIFKRLNSTLDSTKEGIRELEPKTDKVSNLKHKGQCVEFGKKKTTEHPRSMEQHQSNKEETESLKT